MTLSVRLDNKLSEWLDNQAQITGRSRSSLVKEALEKARRSVPSNHRKSFMKLAGQVTGPTNLSQRKGFSKK